MYAYSLCERCAVRNCRRAPTYVNRKIGFRCRKRRTINDGWPLLEVALDCNTVATLEVLYAFGLQLIMTKKGLKAKIKQ
jgi:hypothetical protein